jgi:trehalose synthase
MNNAGLDAKWFTIPPDFRFFDLTKRIHNALQGEKFTFSFEDRCVYMRHMEATAKLMQDMSADVWVIHDPQPAGIIAFLQDFHPSVWRVHIDTSLPNREAWEFFSGFGAMYDRIIFTSKEFVGPALHKNKLKIFSPTIDPLDAKNKALDKEKAKNIIKSFGIDAEKPLAIQVSRFDPWKDPLGVLEAWKIARKKIPDLQLAFLGLFLAQDDPEGKKIFQKVKAAANGEKNIFLFSDLAQIGSLSVETFVNAFQIGADVILQKSIREGFSLTVTEAMWKNHPVIGGNVGGIKLQIKNGKNGFLVSNPKDAGEKIIQLIKNPKLKEKMGEAAKETVREKFLIPRLLRDYLKLFKELV